MRGAGGAKPAPGTKSVIQRSTGKNGDLSGETGDSTREHVQWDLIELKYYCIYIYTHVYNSMSQFTNPIFWPHSSILWILADHLK